MTSDAAGVDLDALLKTVNDEKSFIAFLEALANDFTKEREMEAESSSAPYGPGRLGWENGSVEAVLGAAAAWGRSSTPPLTSNLWHRCAHIIYAGKFYE